MFLYRLLLASFSLTCIFLPSGSRILPFASATVLALGSVMQLEDVLAKVLTRCVGNCASVEQQVNLARTRQVALLISSFVRAVWYSFVCLFLCVCGELDIWKVRLYFANQVK